MQKKTAQKNCEQIFGCLVISEEGKLSLFIHPWPDDAPGIKLPEFFQFYNHCFKNFFQAAAFIVFCTHCQKLQNYSIEEDVALEAKGELLFGMIALSKIQISNALSYTGPPPAWVRNLEETH